MAGPSEHDLIRRFMERVPTEGGEVTLGSGDDAAIVAGREASATSVDAIVEGVHFTRPAFSPEAIGRKALAAALSDLAAMGARPGEAYIALGAPAAESDDALLGIADGVAEVARREGVVIAGGDLTAAPAIFLAVTVVGTAPPGGRLVSRGGARPGDEVVITGSLGGAAAALSELRRGDEADPRAARRQLDPRPRVAAGVALAAAGATAMIDVSDGLLTDAAHVADASNARIELDYRLLPVDEAGGLDRSSVPAAEAVLAGGEEFELIACLPPGAFERAADDVGATGVELTRIGSVSAGDGVTVAGAPPGSEELSGFDHRGG